MRGKFSDMCSFLFCAYIVGGGIVNFNQRIKKQLLMTLLNMS